MEDLQSKVDRLEFYVGLLRNIAQNPDEFSLLDWVIAEKLNENQYDQLMEVLKKANHSLMKQKETGNGDILSLQELSAQIAEVLAIENARLNEKKVEHVIRNAAKLPGFYLLHHYVEQL